MAPRGSTPNWTAGGPLLLPGPNPRLERTQGFRQRARKAGKIIVEPCMAGILEHFHRTTPAGGVHPPAIELRRRYGNQRIGVANQDQRVGMPVCDVVDRGERLPIISDQGMAIATGTVIHDRLEQDQSGRADMTRDALRRRQRRQGRRHLSAR